MPCEIKQRKPRKKETRRRKTKITTLWLSGGLEGLSGPQLKLRLLEIMASSEEGRRRFWARVKKGGPEECWNWIGGKANSGYGVWMVPCGYYKSTAIRPHRISYFFEHGTCPPEIDVLHDCDNTMCVNPRHLFLGDQLDNIADMVKKNRHAKGTMTSLAKLDDNKVREIRLRHAAGENYKNLGIEFGVAECTVGQIVRREGWKHVV